MTAEMNAVKIGGIKTYLLVAWIFSILVNIGVILAFVYYFVVVFLLSGLFRSISYGYSDYFLPSIFAGVGVTLIIILIFMIPSLLVMRHCGKLHGFAKRANIQGLQSNTSVGWGIVALIFTGVIPGIMLLIAHSSISNLNPNTVTSSDTHVGSSSTYTSSFDKLERLKKLLDNGAITQEEFDEQKKRIMKNL